MQKFVRGLMGLLLGCCGLAAQAAPLSTIGDAGSQGDTVMVVLKEDSSPTALMGLTFNFSYDTTLLNFQGFVFGKSLPDWAGGYSSSLDDPSLDPDPSDDFALVSMVLYSDPGVTNTGLLDIDGSLVGLLFNVNATGFRGDTPVSFACYPNDPKADPGAFDPTSCLDNVFEPVSAAVTITPRSASVPAPGTLLLVAAALAALLLARVRRLRMPGARHG